MELQGQGNLRTSEPAPRGAALRSVWRNRYADTRTFVSVLALAVISLSSFDPCLAASDTNGELSLVAPPSETSANHATNSNPPAGDCCAIKPAAPPQLAASGLSTLFNTADFPPRWKCGTWSATHGWIHIAADLAIWAAYLSIPIVLIYCVRKRKDVPFQRIFFLFALFILSCGTAHLMEALISWWPAYRFAALLKVITAVVSWATVLAMLPLLPKALALPGLHKENAELTAELKRRLAAESSLNEQKKRLDAIVNSTLDGLVTMNAQGRIEAFNPVAERLFGLREHSAMGEDMAELIIPPRLRDKHREGLARYLATGTSHLVGERVETSAMRADGTEFPVELAISVITRDGGPVFVGQIRDITERRKAEERFHLAVEAAPNAMIMVDAQGTIVMVNSGTEKLFGYPRREMIGQSVEMFLPEQFRSTHVAHRTAYLAKPQPRAMGEGRDLFARHKNGGLIPVEIGLNPIETKDGVFILSAIVDITERKNAERELKRQSDLLRIQNEQLTATNAELDDFSFVASHDLQEPLRKLVSFSTLLRTDIGGDLPEQASRDLNFITDAATRMQNLVRDLLQLSRAGRGALNIEPLSLNDCVDRAISALSTRIEETGAEIKKPKLPVAMGDPTLVTQLFQNLIGNGLKFVPPGIRPRITLTVEREDELWVLGVKDNGIGLNMEYANQIFQPFKRLHGRQEYEGTGIGLAICRKAVERMGGRIWVESKPGEGAHFKFTMPQECEVPQPDPAPV